jgi:hypothetical protein
MTRRLHLIVLLALTCALPAVAAPPTRSQITTLGDRLDPLLACFGGRDTDFVMDVAVTGPIAGEPIDARLQLIRRNDAMWRLTLDHEQAAMTLDRTADRTLLLLPQHQVAIVGSGPIDGDDTLEPTGAVRRLVSDRSEAFTYINILANSTGQAAALTLVTLADIQPVDEAATKWRSAKADDATLLFTTDGLSVAAEGVAVTLAVSEPAGDSLAELAIPDGYTVRTVDRTEMERVFSRGTRRALEVAAPGYALKNPQGPPRFHEHGEMRWRDDQRLIMLKGTPQQIGEAHGSLLKDELRMCYDSILNMLGIVNTVRTGRWFLDDLRDAWVRLEPFIPEDHKIEMRAMAQAAGLDPQLATIGNVFPELFHCSGFALFGSATADGKLYHGRVLDYMTVVGLQDAAGVFVMDVDGKIPFVTVGYAGFIGSVSGMNAEQISLGEMGGRGEGKWDGTPMATLMRRALEECDTLDEVRQLWTTSPRTCEYYYVFADGKIPDAVGVAATPESIEFIESGAGHERLGPGMPDTVIMSAGSRLDTLRQRVQSGIGQFDADQAMHLMDRPVAMSSNLHNVLFVPQDLMLYVAHADHTRPAAGRHYVEYDFGLLLEAME